MAETLSAEPMPPGPVHWIVHVLSKLMAPVLSLPDGFLLPDQALEAVHESVGALLVIDQLRFLDEP